MRQFIAGIAFLICIMGCTKDFNLDPGQVKSFYVIEGRISNMKGPYYVRVTKSLGPLPENWTDGANNDTTDPVTNALVIITDDNGVADTLIPSTNLFEGMLYRYMGNGVIDSAYGKRILVNTTRERGFYQTTKLQGMPGHTYRLRVEIDGQVFEASAWMPPVPALEHAALRDTTISPFTNVVSIPVAYFKDPPAEKNYYLLKNVHLEKFPYDNYFENAAPIGTSASTRIDYYFFDDKLLVPELNAIPAQFIYEFADFEFYPYPGLETTPIQVRLCSLTKEAYDYIKVISKQVISDGNIYKPAPASPKGNISGALGLFFASHISDKLILPQ